MRRFIATTPIGALALLLTAGWAQAQTPDAKRTERDLVREITELRLEIVQQGIELQRLKLGHLERDLRERRGAKESLEEQARVVNQHLTNVSESAVLQPAHAQELEAARIDLLANQGKLQAAQREVMDQAGMLQAQVQQEEQRLGSLVQKAEKLKGEDKTSPDARR